MGQHYVPQKYLRGFSGVDPDKVWVYDKKRRQFFEAAISKIAQERAFYEDDVEEELNVVVESPANPAIDKLRRREAINAEEQVRLALYIAVMLMRVPNRRLKALEMYPGIIDDTVHRTMEEIKRIGETTDIKPEIVDRRLREAEEARQKFKQQPPQTLVAQIRSPWPSENVVNAICSMRWRYLVASDGPFYFLTSDNPAFFFSAYGVGREESEISLPISSSICLLGNWQAGRDSELFIEVKQIAVKEMNRRNASTATRFLFYQERAPWMEKIAHKERPYLSRILWSSA
jgi:Protein of unknown function (DUF4238)